MSLKLSETIIGCQGLRLFNLFNKDKDKLFHNVFKKYNPKTNNSSEIPNYFSEYIFPRFKDFMGKSLTKSVKNLFSKVSIVMAWNKI